MKTREAFGSRLLRRRAWIALPLGCVVAAALAGTSLKPPSEDNASVGIALKSRLLERAKVPTFGVPPLTGVTLEENPRGFERIPGAIPNAVYITATRANEATALSTALKAATHYVRWLTAREDHWLQGVLRKGGDRGLRPVRRSVLKASARYELEYVGPSPGADGASPALRGALIGLLASGLAAALVIGRRRETALASGDGQRLAPAGASTSPSVAEIAAAGLASAALVALVSTASTGAYTFALIALLFAGGLLYALWGGTGAIRVLLIVVIAVGPLRGALLALADWIDLPNSYLTFNAIQPALIAASAAAVLIAHRQLLRSEPPLLLWGWAAIAMVCVLDFATQTVGLKLYAIGVAQYLVYPTFALVAWPLLGLRDREWLIWAFCALGVLVAVSTFLEVAGVYFTEAVNDPNRFGGATGSVLHSGIFLGTTAVLALGTLFARWTRTNALIAIAAIGVMLAGIALTYTRAGLAIAAIGALVLFVTLGNRNRLRLVVVVIAATAVGLTLSSAVGRTPGQLASRTSAGASLGSYPGNSQRLDAMKNAVNEYRGLPAKEKAFGMGLASTGNASKLTSQEPNPTESYPLKVLVETGGFGALLIGAVLIWTLLCFVRTAWAAPDPLLKGAGAAGVGLFAESLIYPTLEVQLLALTWWVLLVLCVQGRREHLDVLRNTRGGSGFQAVPLEPSETGLRPGIGTASVDSPRGRGDGGDVLSERVSRGGEI